MARSDGRPSCSPSRTRALHGELVAKKLPARPNLDHLRSQAKKHLAKLQQTGTLPDGFRLADAQLHVARESGFASWPALARHVQDLCGLEGEWHFTSLDVDGNSLPPAGLSP